MVQTCNLWTKEGGYGRLQVHFNQGGGNGQDGNEG